MNKGTKRTNRASQSGAAVVYCRVSTRGQAEDGLSLELQQERLRAYCTLRGLEVAEVVLDPGVSGAVPLAERTGGARVVELLETGRAAHVVAMKLDRLFRDAVDALGTVRQWDRRGVALHLADMGGAAFDSVSSMGRMFLTMLAGFAEFEKAQICERTSAGRERKRSQGGYCGGEAPYGWTLTPAGELAPELDEQIIIRAALELEAAGLSLRKVGARLAARGLLPRSGGRWHPQSVKNVLAARLVA